MVDPIMGHRTRDLGIAPWEAEEIGIVDQPNTIAAVMPTGAESPGKGIAAALVAARAFQDRCAELSGRLTDTLTTPLEGYGSYFLFHVPSQRSAARRRLLVMERARQIMELVRREGGTRITIGIGNVSDGQLELPECARRAVIALELAVLQGQACVAYDDVPGEWRSPEFGSSPTRLLQELVESLRDGRLAALETREADYVRAVLVDASGRAEVARTHFECALDALLGVVRAHRTASDRTVVELRERLRAALARADSSPALAAAFHDDVEILIDLEKKPGPVELELKLARAARYVEDRCREPLTLAAVARHVQLSKNYFSSRFKLAYKTGFTEYLARIRIERAKKLLAGSELKISRVGEESGFASVPHFNRVFKKKVGVTPSRFRESRG
jgi:two-component system response regulator YesN